MNLQREYPTLPAPQSTHLHFTDAPSLEKYPLDWEKTQIDNYIIMLESKRHLTFFQDLCRIQLQRFCE